MTDDFMASLDEAIGLFLSSLGGGGSLLETADEAPVFSHRPTRDAIAQHAEHEHHHHGFGAIRRADPEFDLAVFLSRVGEMFLAYHTALDNGELAPIRRFIDEQYYPVVEAAARQQGRSPEGVRALQIRAIRPATALHDNGLDLVRVSISANQGSVDPHILCEYWELIRKTGTLTKPGLNITHCPNCGGPVDGDDPTRCAYCDTRLADPALDWVVRKITAQ